MLPKSRTPAEKIMEHLMMIEVRIAEAKNLLAELEYEKRSYIFDNVHTIAEEFPEIIKIDMPKFHRRYGRPLKQEDAAI